MQKLIAILLLLTATSNLKAQDKIVFAIKGGVGVSWLNTAKAANAPNITIANKTAGVSYGYGIMLDYNIYQSLYASVEVRSASVKGTFEVLESSTFSGVTNTTKNTSGFRTNYIEIPISIKGKTGEFSGMKFYGQVGLVPCINYKSSGNVKFETIGSQTVKEVSDSNFYSNTNKINFGLLVGGGVEYGLMGHTSVIAGLSYRDNYTNMIAVDDPKKYTVKSRYISLDVGIIF
ncbi:MAG: outer membrane beta-barrel protein [Bacteroidetes bacterium]|nr:outer membrane beta-barrel protein [Bacteroidota bacterium]